MKTILILLSSMAIAVAVFISGVAFTAYIIADPEPHRFANMDTPDLWTSSPVAVDASRQDYERIGAVPAIASLPPASRTSEEKVAVADHRNDGEKKGPDIDPMQTAAIGPDDQASAGKMDPAHADWCFDRYRSYRIEDDSYQPYGGGPRRQCQSPWTPMAEDIDAITPNDAAAYDGMAAGQEPAGRNGPATSTVSYDGYSADAPPVGAHEEWCHARYRSYRVEDNSYQPFDGGSRRVCSSPYG